MSICMSKASASEYFGPNISEVSAKRNEYRHQLNETISLKDYIHPNGVVQLHDLVRHNFCFWKREGNQWVPVQLEDYTKSLLAHLYRPMLEEHTDRRVMFFFQQLTAAYSSQLVFRYSPAKDQAESGSKLILRFESEFLERSRNASHSSVLPCLEAYHPESPCPTWCVFAKDSDLYRNSNSTLELPSFINLVCDKSLEDNVRPTAINILNQVSRGEKTPPQGLWEFMHCCLNQLRYILTWKIGGERPVFQIYHDRMEALIVSFQKDARGFIHPLLGLQSDSKLSHELDSLICAHRYRHIRFDMLSQCYFMQEINAISRYVLAVIDADQRYNTKKKKFTKASWSYKEEAFSVALIERFPAIERVALSKLVGFPQQGQIESAIDKRGNGQLTKFNNTLHRIRIFLNSQPFNLTNISTLLQRQQRLQALDRGVVLKTVRQAKQLNGNAFVELCNSRFPSQPINIGDLEAFENQKCIIPEDWAKRFSIVLNVDPTIFIPNSFFK